MLGSSHSSPPTLQQASKKTNLNRSEKKFKPPLHVKAFGQDMQKLPKGLRHFATMLHSEQ